MAHRGGGESAGENFDKVQPRAEHSALSQTEGSALLAGLGQGSAIDRVNAMAAFEKSMPTKDQLSAMSAEELMKHAESFASYMESHKNYMASLGKGVQDGYAQMNADKHLGGLTIVNDA